MFHVCEEPDSGRTTDRIEKKAQDPAGFEPTTSLSWGVWTTAVLQALPHSLTCWFENQSRQDLNQQRVDQLGVILSPSQDKTNQKFAKLWNVLFLDNLKTRSGQKKNSTNIESLPEEKRPWKQTRKRSIGGIISFCLSFFYVLSFSFFSLRHFLSFQILFFLLISFSISLKKLFLNLLLFWSSHKKLWFGFSWFCFKNKVFVAGVRDWIQFLFLMLPSLRWFVVAQKCCYLSFQGQQLFHSFYIWQSGRVLFLAK